MFVQLDARICFRVPLQVHRMLEVKLKHEPAEQSRRLYFYIYWAVVTKKHSQAQPSITLIDTRIHTPCVCTYVLDTDTSSSPWCSCSCTSLIGSSRHAQAEVVINAEYNTNLFVMLFTWAWVWVNILILKHYSLFLLYFTFYCFTFAYFENTFFSPTLLVLLDCIRDKQLRSKFLA